MAPIDSSSSNNFITNQTPHNYDTHQRNTYINSRKLCQAHFCTKIPTI